MMFATRGKLLLIAMLLTVISWFALYRALQWLWPS